MIMLVVCVCDVYCVYCYSSVLWRC